MATRYLCLVFLAAAFPLASAQVATPPPSPAQGPIRISIKNVYEGGVNFGPLGYALRDGTDTVEGLLELHGDKYVGTVTAVVDSNQTLEGLVGDCGPGHYQDSQQLDVVGRTVTGFNDRVQTVTINRATSTGSLSNEYLSLSFKPKTRTRQQPPPDPGQDLIVECHTLIETPSGTFLALNDSRWTMAQGGYIIALPATGVLNYTDNTVSDTQGLGLIPVFNAAKNLWTIRVERLP